MVISCELGQRNNCAFEECGQMIGEFEWYRLPNEIQRMLPLIINFAQQPVDIKCFGSATCDRETLKYVRASFIESIFQVRVMTPLIFPPFP